MPRAAVLDLPASSLFPRSDDCQRAAVDGIQHDFSNISIFVYFVFNSCQDAIACFQEATMTTPSPTHALPTAQEVALAREGGRTLSAFLQTRAETQQIEILDDKGAAHPVRLPVSALRLLVDVLIEIGEGNAVSIIPIHAELTTQEAADVLNVSRPFLVQLLERGEIPFHKIGTHRRVRYLDVIAYKERIDAERGKALEALAEQAMSTADGATRIDASRQTIKVKDDRVAAARSPGSGHWEELQTEDGPVVSAAKVAPYDRNVPPTQSSHRSDSGSSTFAVAILSSSEASRRTSIDDSTKRRTANPQAPPPSRVAATPNSRPRPIGRRRAAFFRVTRSGKTTLPLVSGRKKAHRRGLKSLILLEA
jgi:excisionase family DNA binding protein